MQNSNIRIQSNATVIQNPSTETHRTFMDNIKEQKYKKNNMVTQCSNTEP